MSDIYEAVLRTCCCWRVHFNVRRSDVCRDTSVIVPTVLSNGVLLEEQTESAIN
jgi:hypothetical protein